MKVKELIEKLKEFDGELDIWAYDRYSEILTELHYPEKINFDDEYVIALHTVGEEVYCPECCKSVSPGENHGHVM